jgi:RNA polymerase sigma-70 factor (ECF subfamily)
MTDAMAMPLASRGGYTPLAVELGLTIGDRGPIVPAHRTVDAALDDDLALVTALAKGDAHALEVIYDRYSRGVYSLALRLLSDGPAAEEVVQETFLKLWRHPASYQTNRGRLLPWLLGVAHHHAVDVLRRRQLEQRYRVPPPPRANGDALADMLDNLGLTSTEGDPQTRAGAYEQRSAIHRALDRLPIEQRLPLELAYYKGMTQFEVATLLGLPLGTVKTRMRLGLQQLRKTPELSLLWSER